MESCARLSGWRVRKQLQQRLQPQHRQQQRLQPQPLLRLRRGLLMPAHKGVQQRLLRLRARLHLRQRQQRRWQRQLQVRQRQHLRLQRTSWSQQKTAVAVGVMRG